MALFLLVIVGTALVNLAAAIRFYLFISKGQSPKLPVQDQQDAVIVLAVRGCDPTLPKTINGLLNQNFRDYRVVVVVDSVEDPAWNVLQSIASQSDPKNRLTIQAMDVPRGTCSLKCNAIIGAVEELPLTTRWLGLVDADVEVYPDWLADLLGPLSDPDICVTTGQQWFEPEVTCSKGGLIRSIWNAGAIVPTVLLSHCWAGSMAVRYEDLIISTLIDDWKTSIVDDGPMANFARQMGGSIFVVPKLMMVNREDCTMAFSVTWMIRMLTWSRIYESTFWVTLLHAITGGALVVGWCVALLASVATLDAVGIGWVLSVGLVAVAVLTAGYFVVRRTVDISLSRRELTPLDSKGRIGYKHLLSIAFWMGPVQMIYLYACIKANQASQVCWRGIDYRIDGRNVEMMGYRPYAATSDQETTRSI